MARQKLGLGPLHRPFRSRWRAEPPEAEGPAEAEAPVPSVGPSHRAEPGAAGEPVDLLNPRPATIVDADRLRRAIAFAFAGGDTTGGLRSALRRAPVAASDWDPGSFAAAVFVPELLRTCMAVSLEGLEPELDQTFLARLLTHPPKDPAVVEHRRAILRELAEEPELRGRFQDCYRALHRLRACLEPEAHLLELDDARRRLETLGAIRDVLERMASGFSSCASGLRRIGELAERARASEGYGRLLALLDYDDHLAGVALQLRIGADGRVRRFDIERVTENRANRFYQSPLGRLLVRAGLFLRGYFFTEGELVNRWVDGVFEGVEPLLPPLFQLLGEMELYLAALALKDRAEERGLPVCFADLEGGGERGAVTIEGLWNPLLLGHVPRPVACDLRSEAWRGITVVTGPNSGGKTRLLQGIAIAQMLAQCGLLAPVRAATLGRAAGLFVSLVQEAGADQAEGRLGTELLRIRELFEEARPGALILLDELCSGTNPSEGEEIFRLVISLLPELRPRAFITTHFLQLAARLEAEGAEAPSLSFLQVELDERDCPTYRFRQGVATTSLAQQTAARLGVTRGELLALIRRHRDELDEPRSAPGLPAAAPEGAEKDP